VADPPPPHIAVRRQEQRERRRRRRRVGVGVVAVLVAGAAALLIVLGGAPGHRAPGRARRVLVAGPPQTVSRRPVHSLTAVMAQGNSEIHRLVALGLPVYCGGPHGNEVAFTFDDGPGVYTNLALKKLRQAHERATFFVVGKSINAFPGYLPRELRVAALGDHTYTHPDLEALGPADVRAQLERTAKLIRAQSGQPVDLWRPPYGVSDASIRQIARRLGLLEILWSIDSEDSLGANWSRIIQIVETGLRPGSIVELHENHGQTIRALTTLLPWLRRHHLRSISLPELFASDPPSVGQLRKGWEGCGGNVRSRGGGGVTGE
jgi:peptidoglycan/xylan/chitin deacetylase (PgdA/CDA1 family)